jgi:hemoglobin
MAATIYQQIGGESAVGAVVDDFYGRVLTDPALAPYFDGVDLTRLKAHQRAFVGVALGGPERYEGRGMEAAHKGLRITGDAFDRVVQHLAGSLAAAGVDPSTIQAIAGKLLPLRGEIVSHP